MNLLIAGDFFISDRYRKNSLFDLSSVDVFAPMDYRIVNLEAPITPKNKANEILKTGPHLCTTKEAILPSLIKLKIDLVTLANNHIMDYGQPGLLDTFISLKNVKINAVGAGLNLREAAKPLILEKEGIRIAILNFAENEWAIAKHDKAGANPLDLIENINQIYDARKICEFVIVIIHGGHEYYHLPSPRMTKQYRFYAENGASVVVGHHTHCISGYEVHKGVPVFYSLGNFIFTQPSIFESWYTGLVLNLHIQRDKEISWDLIPVSQSKTDYTMTLLEGKEKEVTLSEIEEYNKIIAAKTLLDRSWEAFLLDRNKHYLNIFSPLNIIRSEYIKLGLIKLGLDRFFIGKKHYTQILSHLRCEAHAETTKGVIERFLG